LIGEHLLTLLKHRLEQAGARAVVVAANKKFQFGGFIRVKSEGKIMVPMMLGNTRLETEVYIVDTKIPFLLGGNLLRQYKTEISVSDNMLILNNQKISLKLLPTGHMAIPWTHKIHEINREDQVLMTIKVPRREWYGREIREAMHKQVEVLQENGTYEEVNREPWMKVIPSMWVINRTTDDDGKLGGKVKARLVVRGDQDMNEEYTPCDSPTVNRTTVKLMIANAANLGWSLRTIDISAAFLQG